jgi:TRAP-type C4-dicarboxylate transport system permease small subunit
MNAIKKIFFKIDGVIAKIETALICLVMTFLFGVGFYQVASRELANAGAVWPEHLLRYSVLVIGFLGAGLAVRGNRNIRIDLLTHFLESRRTGLWWRITEGMLNLAAAAFSIILAEATVEYIKVEKMLSMPIPNTTIPTHWMYYFPLVFFIISFVRFAFYGLFKFAGVDIETHHIISEKKS